ncbi:hypothetical protein ACFOOJ_00925 [Sphingobium xenophagum]|jgi:hypothetical protein|uniref:hypothetical protein n=1 Tax=Sphingobium xenophagum TaxID=121428 RepID=UPI00157BCDE9|nr:hypothetical protein [Sphingobium xenophagum]
MRVNTAKSMKLARYVKAKYGTWQAMRRAARLENGIFIIDRGAAGDEEAKAPHPAKSI